MQYPAFYLFVITILIQAGYILYYFIPFNRYHPPTRTEADLPVSVILAAHNDGELLKQFLPLILTQDYPEFEVLVADDRSGDETKKNLTELSRLYPNLRILPIDQTPPGIHPKKFALHQAIMAARHEHLLFTDADCRPVSDLWIREMAKGFFGETAVVLGFSPYIRISGFLNYLIRYETFLSALQYLSFALKGNTYMGVGRNLAYTKAVFQEAGGFGPHQNQVGGDDDLFVQQARIGKKVNVVFHRNGQTESIPKTRYLDWIIQKRRHLAIGQLYKWPDKFRVGIFMLGNILFYLTLGFLLARQTDLFLVGLWAGGRCVLVYGVYWWSGLKLKERIPVLLLPVLDVVYFWNYLLLGISVLMFKKVRWK